MRYFPVTVLKNPGFARDFVRHLGALVAALLVFLPLGARAIEIVKVETGLGLKALLVEDHALPLVTVSFAFAGGATQDPEGKTGALNLMSALLYEGAGPYAADAFQDRLEDLAAHISFSADRDFLFGSLRTLSARAPEAFEMLRLALYEPHFDEKPLNRIRDQILSGIRSAENDPNALASKAMRELIYPQGHPYRRSTQGTRETVSSLTAEDLKAIKAKIMARGNLVVSVVGDITPDDLKDRLDALFGELPEKADLRPVEAVEPRLGGMRLI